MHSYRFAGGALVAAGLLNGCKTEQRPADTTASSPQTVSVVAKDFGYDAPDTIPAGATTIVLRNGGKELHHAQLVKLEDGKTIADVAKVLKEHAPAPSWLKFVGGPNAVVPGKEVSATSVLEPGHYALMCFIFGPDGVPHAVKGMVRELHVTDAPATASKTLPAADVTVKLVDYGFEPSGPLTPGRRTILVENAGLQPHELALIRLAPGKKIEDFAGWAEGGLKGPPPGEPIGGVVFLDKGASGTFTADLTAGDYGLICFYPDTKDGKPHLAHGMVTNLKVG